jgi:hypothetical protein
MGTGWCARLGRRSPSALLRGRPLRACHRADHHPHASNVSRTPRARRAYPPTTWTRHFVLDDLCESAQRHAEAWADPPPHGELLVVGLALVGHEPHEPPGNRHLRTPGTGQTEKLQRAEASLIAPGARALAPADDGIHSSGPTRSATRSQTKLSGVDEHGLRPCEFSDIHHRPSRRKRDAGSDRAEPRRVNCGRGRSEGGRYHLSPAGPTVAT